ncbi:MAG: NAD-dependent epimerase/dehydratase family protein [Nitrososphaerota archaeon]|nr:NAD-dependent epimerase/dehydratase family protein [Nitrososphaerota archaeon]
MVKEGTSPAKTVDGECHVVVTGGAGVIGSAMVKRLLPDSAITIIDDLSSGTLDHLSEAANHPHFNFIKGNISKIKEVAPLMKNAKVVYHFAANADVRFRPDQPTDLDLKSGTVGTYNILEEMRRNDVEEIVFSSSSAVYGEPDVKPTPESYGPLMPESLYGASKLACEGLISAFSATYGLKAWIYRFANIVGSESRTTGKNVIPDFIGKLRQNKDELVILGDGAQTKSYLHIDDCIEGMLALMRREGMVNIYNLGSKDTITVREIADIVVDEMHLKDVKYSFTGGKKGWKGDIPYMHLDTTKATNSGWSAKRNSAQAVRLSARSLIRAARE